MQEEGESESKMAQYVRYLNVFLLYLIAAQCIVSGSHLTHLGDNKDLFPVCYHPSHSMCIKLSNYDGKSILQCCLAFT